MVQNAFAYVGSNPRHLKRIGSEKEQNEMKHSNNRDGKRNFTTWIVIGSVFVILLAALVLMARCKAAWKKRQRQIGIATFTVNNEMKAASVHI